MSSATAPRRPGRELAAPLRLVAYALVVAAAFGAAYALGSVLTPLQPRAAAEPGTAAGQQATPSADDHGDEGTSPAHQDAAHGPSAGSPASQEVAGLTVSADGYTLVLADPVVTAESAVPVRFSITGPDGRPVTTYDVEHEQELHLIAVRRDGSGYQHVHPARAEDGTWSASLDLRAAGTYRLFADFTPSDEPAQVLGADLQVAGTFEPASLPPPRETVGVDGYDVSIEGAPVAGAPSTLTFTVTRDGRPVTELEPYLGAYGHLVSLRDGDLAYLHTHPVQDAPTGGTGGPAVSFETTFPTQGAYRLYLDFVVDGVVRTAEAVVVVGGQS